MGQKMIHGSQGKTWRTAQRKSKLSMRMKMQMLLLKNEGESQHPDRGQGPVEGQHPRAENPQVARNWPLSNRRRLFDGPVDLGPGVVSKPQWRPSQRKWRNFLMTRTKSKRFSQKPRRLLPDLAELLHQWRAKWGTQWRPGIDSWPPPTTLPSSSSPASLSSRSVLCWSLTSTWSRPGLGSQRLCHLFRNIFKDCGQLPSANQEESEAVT